MFKLFKAPQFNVNGPNDTNSSSSSSSPSDAFDQVNGQSWFDSPNQSDMLSDVSATTTSAASGPSGSTEKASTSGSGGGLAFNNTFGASCSAAFENCVFAAESQLSSLITNSHTINVSFQEVNEGNNHIALSNNFGGIDVGYNALRAALVAANPADSFLPATDPSGGGGTADNWFVPTSYARMLGLTGATGSPDLTVTLNSYYNWQFGQDVINGLTHEMSEGGLGRIGGLGGSSGGAGSWSVMDLFRYNAAGNPDYTNGRDGQTTYFSNNGGATLSNQNNPAKGAPTLSFNNQYNNFGTKVNGGDTADWTQTSVFGSTGTGETLTLTQTELDLLQALGWNISLQQDVLTGVAWETANDRFSDWSTGSMPITAQDAYIATTGLATLNSNVIVHSVGTGASTIFLIGTNTACKLIAIDGTALNVADSSSVGSGNNGQLAVEPGSALQIGNTFTNTGKLGIGKGAGGSGNNAALYLNNTLGPVTLNGGGTVGLGQLASGSEIQTYGDILNAPGTSGDGLDNVDNTITGGGVISLGTFDNQASGSVVASQAGGFWLQVSAATFSNEGIMTADSNATLDLGADGATETLTNNGNGTTTGAIDIDGGGRLAISGNLTIAGSGAINFKGAGASIASDGLPATFTNDATIQTSFSGQIGDVDLTFDNNGKVGASGSGVTLTINTGGNTVTNGSSGLLQAESGATLAIRSNASNQGTIAAGTSSTTGTVVLGKDGGTESMTNTGVIEIFAGSDLAIAGNYTITTPFGSSGEIDFKGAGADITSDGKGAATFTNASTINAEVSGQIGDTGILAVNDLTFHNNDTVDALGSGVTLTINTGALAVLNGTNGVLQAESGATLSILSNVTNQGAIAAGTSSFSSVGATTGTVDLGKDGSAESMANTGSVVVYGGSDLAISGNYTITGTGKVFLKGAGADITSDGKAAATLTNKSTIEADASGQIGDHGIKAVNDLTFVNKGTVVATGAGVTLTLDTGNHAINDSGGLLEAENGARLVVDSNISGSLGTIEVASGSTVTLSKVVTSVTAPVKFLAGGTLDILGNATKVGVSGSSGTIAVKGLNDGLTDGGASDTFQIGQNVGKLSVSNFGLDPTGIIDLLNGVGGFATATAAFAALTSDGSGGSLLSLGADGSIDLKGIAPSALHVTNFKIG